MDKLRQKAGKCLAYLLILCMLAANAACEQKGDEISDPDNPDTVTNTLPTPTPLPTDKFFGLAWTQETPFDPLTTQSSLNIDLSSLLYDSLFLVHNDLSFENSLCQSYETAGNDYTLHLEKNVKFHSGIKLKAQDVVYTIDRILSNKDSAFYSRISDIYSAKASDDYTVIISLKKPSAGLPALLDFPIIRDGTGTDNIADGTGRYQLAKDGGAYYLKAFGGRTPKKELPYSRIELTNITTMDELADAFETGAVDYTAVNILGAPLVAIISSYQTISCPTDTMQYLGFNRYSIFSNANIRQAVGLLIDRTTLCSDSLAGAAVPSDNYFPPETVYSSGSEGSVYDSGKAKKMLAGSGITASSPVSVSLIVCSDNETRVNAANYIAKSLTEAGLKTEVKPLASDDYIKALRNGNYDLYYARTKLTADWNLTVMAGSGGALNHARLSTWELDTALNTYVQASGDARVAAAKTVETLMEAELPYLVLCYEYRRVYLRTDIVTNASPSISDLFAGMTEWEKGT